MTPEDTKRITTFYEETLAQYGDNDPRSVHWINADSQSVRFDVLCRVGDLEHASLLDVGCGLGDLYKYLLSKKIPVEYTGVDVVPALVSVCSIRFPEARFLCDDVVNIRDSYDYILASGALSFAVPQGKEYYFNIIKVMHEHARKGIAFNMLNRAAHVSDDTFLSYDVDEVVSFCKTLSPRVEVVQNYLPWDFTVYMYKE